jgi:hypothetical protein
MAAFLFALFLICGSTLAYEIALTRLLSVVSWYYLAFISVAMAMFGMTAGALFVQLWPERFTAEQISRRLVQAAVGMAASLPICLLIMLAMPVNVFVSLESLVSYLFFSAVIAVPFFFSGVVVCLSLTRTQVPIGITYGADLLGAAAGCAGSVILLNIFDAPSAILCISAMVFLGAAFYAVHAKDGRYRNRLLAWAAVMIVLAALNASTTRGIQPIWAKGALDSRSDLLLETWNPISKVRVRERLPSPGPPWMWGPSPHMPEVSVETLELDIDNDAGTPMMRYHGDLKEFDFLRYDVTSIASQLRTGGSAAIIGLGGGRDALTALTNGFHRVVGIDVNCAIVDVTTKRFASFSGFDRIAGLEVHCDEARSFLTRSEEKFDVIQASLVDTWAATSAGSLSLSENALYTVDGWKIFFAHLKPGGLISFTRHYYGPETFQTYRLFALAWATLLSEGVQDPGQYVAVIRAGGVANLIVSNQPLSGADVQKLRSLVQEMSFSALYLPGEAVTIPELRRITEAKSLDKLWELRYAGDVDFSPVYDSSPFFFNSVRLRNLTHFQGRTAKGGSYRATLFLLSFMFCALLLVIFAILWPLKRFGRRSGSSVSFSGGGIIYFTAIGLAFGLVEIAMMQQLSIFLGHPIYSLVVVLAGLILFAGAGSLASEKIVATTVFVSRLPALVSAVVILIYFVAVLPVIHGTVAASLWQRVALTLALVAPCGLIMGFCFPVGLRRLKTLGFEESLPWMWALNGAASVLASFLAVLISMESSIGVCVLTGAALYVLAGLALPGTSAERVGLQPKLGSQGAGA